MRGGGAFGEVVFVLSAHRSAPVPPTNAPALVTRERVVAWLERSGYTFFLDNDGDVGGIWDNRMFHFLLLGEGSAFQIRGQWNRIAGLEQLQPVLEFTNSWNADRIWPKAFVRVRDDGSVVVCADLTVTASSGFTDAQLDLQLRCGLATAAALFDAFDEEFPDPMQAPARR